MNGFPCRNIYEDNKLSNHGKFTFERGVWTDWTYFEVKVYLKGSMHLKFKDENVWKKLNAAYGKLKGFTLYENQ